MLYMSFACCAKTTCKIATSCRFYYKFHQLLKPAITEDGCHSVKISLSRPFPDLPPGPDGRGISALGLMSYLLKAIAKLSVFAKIFFKIFYADSWQPLKKVAFSRRWIYKISIKYSTSHKLNILNTNPRFESRLQTFISLRE